MDGDHAWMRAPRKRRSAGSWTTFAARSSRRVGLAWEIMSRRSKSATARTSGQDCPNTSTSSLRRTLSQELWHPSRETMTWPCHPFAGQIDEMKANVIAAVPLGRMGPADPDVLRSLRRGLACLYRDCHVIITNWSDAPISWPRRQRRGQRGGSGLLVPPQPWHTSCQAGNFCATPRRSTGSRSTRFSTAVPPGDTVRHRFFCGSRNQAGRQSPGRASGGIGTTA